VIADKPAVARVPDVETVSGARAMVFSWHNPVLSDQVACAAGNVNAEVDVLDDVRFDGVAVAGHGNTGGLFGHLTPAVADDKTAQPSPDTPGIKRLILRGAAIFGGVSVKN